MLVHYVNSLEGVEAFTVVLMFQLLGVLFMFSPHISLFAGLFIGIGLVLTGRASDNRMKTGIFFVIGFFLTLGYVFSSGVPSFAICLASVTSLIISYLSFAATVYNMFAKTVENRKKNILISLAVFITAALTSQFIEFIQI